MSHERRKPTVVLFLEQRDSLALIFELYDATAAQIFAHGVLDQTQMLRVQASFKTAGVSEARLDHLERIMRRMLGRHTQVEAVASLPSERSGWEVIL